MIIKILWTLICLNSAALVIVFFMFLASTNGRNVDYMEKGWMTIIFAISLVVIFLAAIPLRFSQSNLTLIFSGIFAALPLVIGLGVLISNNLPTFKNKETMAELYYKDKTQRAIATAIEKGDTLLVKELINGQDLNIQGTRVWDWDGLNYLQFAIRLHSNADSTFNKPANESIICTLVSSGSATTPALPEAITTLPLELVSVLLEAGADPNTTGFVNSDPLLFSAIGQTKEENDIAILLIQKGAEIDVRNNEGNTPLMFAANNASTGLSWTDTWRLIRYLLETANADYKYTRSDGVNFTSIVQSIEVRADAEKVTMPVDFITVVNWLKDHANRETTNL